METVKMQSGAGFDKEKIGCGKIVTFGNKMDLTMLPEDEEPRLSFDEISSPLNEQLLELCDPDLFEGETALTISEVASCSNNLSLICDIRNDNISTSIDFSLGQQIPNPHQDVPNFSQIQVADNSICSVVFDGLQEMNSFGVISQCPQPVLDECFSNMHSYFHMNPSNPTPPSSCSSCLDFSLPRLSNLSPGALSVVGGNDGPQMFRGSNLLTSSESQICEMDFISDNNGLFCHDSLQQSIRSNEIQALCGENGGQWIRPEGINENNLSTEMSSLDGEANYKIGKLSIEQRKEKIHKYLKKRNERNFSKKIKYACRKTLADSRPRVRGRFAKNDEYVERHDEDEDDDVHVKDEDDISDSDIFAHISGVNSFKFSNPIQSWI